MRNYINLYNVHIELGKWADKNQVKFKGPRTEFYPTDPAVEPNPEKWHTDILEQVEAE